MADIGLGGGYFALAFARKVGRGGKLFAVDGRPGYLDFVKRNAEAADRRRFRARCDAAGT